MATGEPRCPNCGHGYGVVMGVATARPPARRCPVCDGRGTMPHNFYTRLEASTSTEPVMCKSCNGRGVL